MAGAGALLAMSANLFDVVLGVSETDIVAPGSRSAVEWYEYFQASNFKGLYMLGILNIVYMVSMIPVYLGLFVVHYHRHFVLAVTANLLFLLALAIYVSNNAAVPMAVLSEKYAMADTVAERTILAAAGESVLARGEDFTPGAFPGLILGGIAAVIISLVMLLGGIFSRGNAWVGIIGFSLLSLFTITATFTPSMYAFSYYVLGGIGGLLALTWFLLTALRFFRLAQDW